MKTKTLNLIITVLGYFGSLLLTVFSGLFAMISLSALVLSIIEKDLLSVVACGAAGFIAWMMWDIRKDTLV